MFRRVKGYLERFTGRRPHTLDGITREHGDLIARIRARRLTYLSKAKLASVIQTCSAIEKARLPGIFVEAGCALGGSAIAIATVKRPDRPFLVYDVFGMIPAPTAQDTSDVHERYETIIQGKAVGIDGDPCYGYEPNLYEVVEANLRSFGIDCQERSVSLIQGLVQETMSIDQPVAFAHVDVDWYEPVLTCLQRVFPKLVLGGSIILDDYHAWGGCRKATDEYIEPVSDQIALDDSAGSMKITRVKADPEPKPATRAEHQDGTGASTPPEGKGPAAAGAGSAGIGR